MFVLLRGTAEELKKLGSRGIIIRNVYGRSQTPPGIAMAMHMGMKEYAPLPRTGKLVRFVLDVNTSDSFLAKMYREGFAEWEREHNTHKGTKRKTVKTEQEPVTT